LTSGNNYVIASDADRSYCRAYSGVTVTFVSRVHIADLTPGAE